MINFLGVNATYVMIADNSDERQSLELFLECIHDIIQHFLMDLAFTTVPLYEVAHLECHHCAVIHQSDASFQKSWAPVTPHLPISGELRALYSVEPFNRFVVE